MSFAPPPTRAAAVLDQLRAEIVGGVLAPGEILKDAELATRLGVSITPVREAIAELAREGLVEVSPNRWRRVAEMTLEQAVATIDIQFILFGGAVERAVPQFTDEDVVQLEANVAEMRRAIADGEPASTAKAVAQFFELTIARAGNAELSGVWNLVFGRGRRFMGLTATSNLWQLWLDGFTEVFAAVQKRDADLAGRRVREMATTIRETTLGPEAHGYILGAPSSNSPANP
ncbi:GntR family transcriptional regulator [Rhodococcus koreensis]|jgi:DNA-binding GntR family transcriptional regulator|uniref:DNA-binding transcriptional regulator, GntR family n=1 Tax=Rhodococcus koreensis TaxID=99653 RepID=A0A1H4MFN7_9NOCA|nr:GntR family transcriptional regulator [Rhodococcus koreensis]QSE84537.1 GntR family transcriptional regulator [Rhodococcus koreensis]SEB81930.1 DNA-binding transcriptional regulator, GntR family [Rhodococcus koreensis]